MILYLLAAVAGVVLQWTHVIGAVWMLLAIMVFGFLEYFERCPRCGHSYLMQKGKSILKLGEGCANCGRPFDP
jgi:transposase-like protein